MKLTLLVLLPESRGMEASSKPLLVYAKSSQAAIDRLVAELAMLADGGRIPLSSFLVFYGAKVHRQALHARLARQFGAGRGWWFNKEETRRRNRRKGTAAGRPKI